MRRDIRGAKLGLDRAGRGVPLVLLHAFPVDRRMWSAVAEELALDADMIAIDFPGLGESEPPPAGAPSIDGAADDVAAVHGTRGIARAVVAGLSMGGYVALAFAERRPGRVLGLALADTRAAADTPEQRAARDTAIARVAREGSADYVRDLIPRLVAPGSREVRDLALAIASLQPPMGVAGALAALRDRADRGALLPAIRAPATVIVGLEDTVTPPAEAQGMAAAIPGATLVEIPGAGHLSALEAPRPFAAALRSLLARVQAPSR